MNKELAIECIKTQRQFVDDLTKEAFDVAIDLLKQPERTGRWVKANGKTAINCSACYHCSWSRSFEDTVKRFNFCPNCGADMTEGKE